MFVKNVSLCGGNLYQSQNILINLNYVKYVTTYQYHS